MKIKFGTGGIRGIMGEGEEQLNKRVIQKVTLGVSFYLKKMTDNPKVAICYDSRNNSRDFARQAAEVFAFQGCRVYLSETLMPTPFLSYVIRKEQCDLGVSITASHNSKEYNGYKVYNHEGCQITEKAAKKIQQEIENLHKEKIIIEGSFEDYREKKIIQYISKENVEDFSRDILTYGFTHKVSEELKVVYSPLNGAGKECVCKVLKEKGVKNLFLVPEQSEPNGDFPTCPYPNPEDDRAMEAGIKLCEKKEAHLFLATDPDGDRVGVAAKRKGKYERLSGNQVGVLLLDYMLRRKKEAGQLPENSLILKTIVTTEMVRKIAAKYGILVMDTLTGFKYIGEQVGELEKKGELKHFIFGVEESCGYLIGPYVRDKDGVGAAMMICEMAEEYRKQGKTLWDRLEELYGEYGYYETITRTKNCSAEEAKEYMEGLRERLQAGNVLEEFGGKVREYRDYRKKQGSLPRANVLKIWFEGGESLVVRPSGTEPKIKFYQEKIV